MAIKTTQIVLLTGGAGFIGSKVSALLLERGLKIRVLDNLSTGYRNLLSEDVEFIEGDIRDLDTVNNAVDGCQSVIHFAAQAIVPNSIENPQNTFDINLVGGQNLLEAMRKSNVKKLVFSSSCATYGVPRRVPIYEDDPQLPISPYGASKLAFENMIRAYHASYGLEAVILRYFNPYGPFETHDPETHAIPNFIKATLSGRPIPLYWDGEQKRDFFYVYDLAEAHLKALSHRGFDHFNIGSGSGTKVKDIVGLIFELTGKSSPIEDLGERVGDPPELYASIEKARKVLGWEPKTDLKTGLKATVDYFMQNYANKI